MEALLLLGALLLLLLGALPPAVPVPPAPRELARAVLEAHGQDAGTGLKLLKLQGVTRTVGACSAAERFSPRGGFAPRRRRPFFLFFPPAEVRLGHALHHQPHRPRDGLPQKPRCAATRWLQSPAGPGRCGVTPKHEGGHRPLPCLATTLPSTPGTGSGCSPGPFASSPCRSREFGPPGLPQGQRQALASLGFPTAPSQGWGLSASPPPSVSPPSPRQVQHCVAQISVFAFLPDVPLSMVECGRQPVRAPRVPFSPDISGLGSPWGQRPPLGDEAHPDFLSFSPVARGSPAPKVGAAQGPREPSASGTRHHPESLQAHLSCGRGPPDPIPQTPSRMELK